MEAIQFDQIDMRQNQQWDTATIMIKLHLFSPLNMPITLKGKYNLVYESNPMWSLQRAIQILLKDHFSIN